MLPVTGIKTDDRERCIYPAQPSKVEPFLKVNVRRPSAQVVAYATVGQEAGTKEEQVKMTH